MAVDDLVILQRARRHTNWNLHVRQRNESDNRGNEVDSRVVLKTRIVSAQISIYVNRTQELIHIVILHRVRIGVGKNAQESHKDC